MRLRIYRARGMMRPGVGVDGHKVPRASRLLDCLAGLGTWRATGDMLVREKHLMRPIVEVAAQTKTNLAFAKRVRAGSARGREGELGSERGTAGAEREP